MCPAALNIRIRTSTWKPEYNTYGVTAKEVFNTSLSSETGWAPKLASRATIIYTSGVVATIVAGISG